MFPSLISIAFVSLIRWDDLQGELAQPAVPHLARKLTARKLTLASSKITHLSQHDGGREDLNPVLHFVELL